MPAIDEPQPVKHTRRRRQISLSAMLVLMLIFTVASAALFYAGRIEVVQQELQMYFGIRSTGTGESSRRAHLTFLLFTYSSPLLLAMVLSTAMGMMNRRR